MLVTDKLAYLILLSLTFIYLNQLIIDAKTETVIDKCCGYNIMISNSKIPTFLTLIMEVSDISHRSGKKISLDLIDTCLQELNKKYYKEFSDYFEEISHIHQLPTNIYHYIKLKYYFISFTARIYSCS